MKKTISKVVFRLDEPSKFIAELDQNTSYKNSRDVARAEAEA